MEMGFHIREVEKGDNAPLALMIRQVFEEYDAPRKGTVYTDPTTDDLFSLFQEAESKLWVAECNGKALLECSLSSARELGYTHLYLESMPEFSKALGIYEQLGFISLVGPLGNSGHTGCKIWMLKELYGLL